MRDGIQHPFRWHLWVSRAIILAVSLLIYGQSVRFGFTTLDDDFMIGAIVDRGTQISQAFTADATMVKGGSSFYRPLQTISYMHDGYWSGKSPRAYHITNLILFGLACCTLFSLLLALGIPHGPAFTGTLLFTVHPLFAQVAAWIPARGDLLFALFGMLSMIALTRFRATGSLPAAGAHLAVFALATLSKETAVMLPPVFAVYLLAGSRSTERRTRGTAFIVIGWLILIGCFLALRSVAIHGLPEQNSFGIAVLAGNLATLPETVANLFWPINLGPLPSFTGWRTLTGILLIGIISALCMRRRQRSWPTLLLGSTWFICLSLPGMLYRHELGRYAYNYLHHRTFLPLVGVLIILLQLLPSSCSTITGKWLRGAVVVAVATLSLLAYRQARVFSTPFAFYNAAIRTNPDSALAFTNRGILKAMQGDFHHATLDFDTALKIVPGYYLALSNRASAKGDLGDPFGAIQDLTAAIRQQPAFPNAYNSRGHWRYLVKDYAGAAADFDEALRLDPDLAAAYGNRGILQATQGDDTGALRNLTQAIQLNPYLPESWHTLGMLSLRRGEVKDACSQWRNAMNLGYRESKTLVQQYCR